MAPAATRWAEVWRGGLVAPGSICSGTDGHAPTFRGGTTPWLLCRRVAAWMTATRRQRAKGQRWASTVGAAALPAGRRGATLPLSRGRTLPAPFSAEPLAVLFDRLLLSPSLSLPFCRRAVMRRSMPQARAQRETRERTPARLLLPPPSARAPSRRWRRQRRRRAGR